MSVDARGFAAGTWVHTKEGRKAIEEVRAGEWVLSYPAARIPPPRLREPQEYSYRQVKSVVASDDSPLCEVTAWDLGNDIKEVIKVAPGHLLFIKNAGWVPAGTAKFGNALLTTEFANLMLKTREDSAARARVFDLEVDEFRTYYVGELGVWALGVIPKV